MGRSDPSLRGVSVSSSSSGTRPTWTIQTATWTVRPGSSTGTVSGSPSWSATRRIGSAGRVEVGVGVLLVAVRVDRLAEVAVAVEQAHGDERQRHVRGGLAVVAREHAQAAGVDAQRLVEPELGAEVGDRSLEPRRRDGARTSCREPFVHVRVEAAQQGPVLDHEVRVVQERRVQSRGAWSTGTGFRWRWYVGRSMRAKRARISGCHDQ